MKASILVSNIRKDVVQWAHFHFQIQYWPPHLPTPVIFIVFLEKITSFAFKEILWNVTIEECGHDGLGALTSRETGRENLCVYKLLPSWLQRMEMYSPALCSAQAWTHHEHSKSLSRPYSHILDKAAHSKFVPIHRLFLNMFLKCCQQTTLFSIERPTVTCKTSMTKTYYN